MRRVMRMKVGMAMRSRSRIQVVIIVVKVVNNIIREWRIAATVRHWASPARLFPLSPWSPKMLAQSIGDDTTAVLHNLARRASLVVGNARVAADDGRSALAVAVERVAKVGGGRGMSAILGQVLIAVTVDYFDARAGHARLGRFDGFGSPLGFLAQPLGHVLVPCEHVIIGLFRESLFWQQLGKDLGRGRVDNVKLGDAVLQKRNVLVWTKQQLDGLPCHKALWLQRGYRRYCVAVRVRGRLERVQTSERLVDEADGGGGSVEEENVVVAADSLVKGGELCGGDVCAVLGGAEVGGLCGEAEVSGGTTRRRPWC